MNFHKLVHLKGFLELSFSPLLYCWLYRVKRTRVQNCDPLRLWICHHGNKQNKSVNKDKRKCPLSLVCNKQVINTAELFQDRTTILLQSWLMLFLIILPPGILFSSKDGYEFWERPYFKLQLILISRCKIQIIQG